MITMEMVAPIGRSFKPHSYKGEVNVDIDYDKEIFSGSKNCVLIKIDNILVPFFVESIGGGIKGTSHLKLKGIESDLQAAMIANKELFMLKSDLAKQLGISEEDLEVYSDQLEGFTVLDAQNGMVIGKVVGSEEGKEYDYILVEKDSDGNIVYIPFVDEMIMEITDRSEEGEGVIKVSLPEGYLEI